MLKKNISHLLYRRGVFLMMLSFMALILVIPEEADARRNGFSSSRSRSRSSSRSRPRTRTSGSRSSRPSGESRRTSSRRQKGVGLGSLIGSSDSRARSQRAPSHGSSHTRRRARYRDRGTWWLRTSSRKSGWRTSRKPRRRFRSSFYNRPLPIVDIWDPYFLASAATPLFWYHHWQDQEIQEALYTDHVLEDAELVSLEREVQALEAQNIPRDPDFLPEGIGPEDAYSDAFLDRERKRQEEGGGGLIFLGFVAIGLGVGFRFFRG